MPPTPAEEKGKNLLYFLSPAIAALVFFLYALRPGYIFFWYDTSLIHLPLKQFFHNSIASGDFPTWARHFLFGFPILGHGDAAYLYPLSAVLFSLFEPTRIYNVFIVSHYLLAGLFCYCFLRALAVRRESAAFGAIIYALNGFSLGHLHHATILCGYAYLPLLLWAVEIAARGNPFRGALIWALGLWLVTTASQPQMLLYCVCVSAAFWLWRALSQEKSNRLLPTRILAMLVGTAAGAMLAALHIIPFL
ncbi:MAG TPA: hypothetical protein PKH07_17160, partial [bacterium]|nr:hypothetical protein [bacterium]